MDERGNLTDWLSNPHGAGEEKVERGLPFLAVRRKDHGLSVPLDKVRTVARLETFSPLPGAPPLLPGATSLQGRIVALLDLGPLLDEEAIQPQLGMYVVVINQGNVEAGLVVTQALDMHMVPEEHIQKEEKNPYLVGRYAWPLDDPHEAFDVVNVPKVLEAAQHVFG